MIKRNSVAKKGGSSNTILAELFRKIITQSGLTASAFIDLVDRWLNSNAAAMGNDPVKLMQMRSNIQKGIHQNTMTWADFCRRLLYINVKRFHIRITLERSGGNTSTHEIMVDLTDKELEDEPSGSDASE